MGAATTLTSAMYGGAIASVRTAPANPNERRERAHTPRRRRRARPAIVDDAPLSRHPSVSLPMRARGTMKVPQLTLSEDFYFVRLRTSAHRVRFAGKG